MAWFNVYFCSHLGPIRFQVLSEFHGNLSHILRTEMEMKRFFSMLKHWVRLDKSWTQEFVNLDAYFRGTGAKQCFEVDDHQGHTEIMKNPSLRSHNEGL